MSPETNLYSLLNRYCFYRRRKSNPTTGKTRESYMGFLSCIVLSLSFFGDPREWIVKLVSGSFSRLGRCPNPRFPFGLRSTTFPRQTWKMSRGTSLVVSTDISLGPRRDTPCPVLVSPQKGVSGRLSPVAPHDPYTLE